jgi:hypothetical protein
VFEILLIFFGFPEWGPVQTTTRRGQRGGVTFESLRLSHLGRVLINTQMSAFGREAEIFCSF